MQYNTTLICTLLYTKNIFLFSILIYSSIFIVLEGKLTKYQQIHPDTALAAEQMCAILFAFVMETLWYL